jgi:hypothetical protein
MAETYDAYALLNQRAAGQYWSGGQVAGQWAWSPQTPTVSDIQWGDPAAWPPPTFERFERVGDWVMMLGYGDNSGTFLKQVVTAEWSGPSLSTLTPLPVDSQQRQRYTRWTIPTQSYSMVAEGTMDWQGTLIHWRHQQTWSPPGSVSNAYFSARQCIRQAEVWWDDLGTAGQMVEKVRRDHYLARGLGVAYKIVDQLHTWQADGRYYWRWG